MHYTVKFTGSPEEQRKQALRACKQYLGAARFLRIRRLLVDDAIKYELSYRQLRRSSKFALAMIGVQGRTPCEAIARDVWASVKAVASIRAEIHARCEA